MILKDADATEAAGRILVCISSQSPRAAKLLRRASRMAGRFNTDWFAVYVETPEEAPDRIDAGAQRMLHTNIQIARDLGAEVIRLKGHDPVVAGEARIDPRARSMRTGRARTSPAATSGLTRSPSPCALRATAAAFR